MITVYVAALLTFFSFYLLILFVCLSVQCRLRECNSFLFISVYRFVFFYSGLSQIYFIHFICVCVCVCSNVCTYINVEELIHVCMCTWMTEDNLELSPFSTICLGFWRDFSLAWNSLHSLHWQIGVLFTHLAPRDGKWTGIASTSHHERPCFISVDHGGLTQIYMLAWQTFYQMSSLFWPARCVLSVRKYIIDFYHYVTLHYGTLLFSLVEYHFILVY